MTNFKSIKEILKNTVSDLGAKQRFVSAFYRSTSGLAVQASLKQSSAAPLPYSCGVTLRAIQNGISYEASTTLLTESNIQRAATVLQNQLDDKKSESRHHYTVDEEPIEQHFQSEMNDEFSLQKKLKHAQSTAQHIQSLNNRSIASSVIYRNILTDEIYVSANRQLSQNLSRFEAIYSTMLKDKQLNAHVFDGFARAGGWAHMGADQTFLESMVADAEKILYAKRLEPGFYDCIFSPSVAGMLAHEAFGHGTEADTMVKGRAKGSDYLGKDVASEKVSLYDSPALEGAAASYYFDHEGYLSSETKIIEKGKLVNPITDARSASLLGIKRTANGRREAYDHKIYTRMTNTFFKPGTDKLEDMITSIQNGFFIKRATNGMEDPKSWGIQLEALFAEKITDGKLTGEVFSPVIVTGYVPDILRSISMVSAEMQINGLGMCGKGYKEWVKVTDGGPYLKLKARLA